VYDRRRMASLKSSCFLSMNSRTRDSISTNLEMRGELNSAILHGRPQVVPEYFEGRRLKLRYDGDAGLSCESEVVPLGGADLSGAKGLRRH